jgi:hypothetical protein
MTNKEMDALSDIELYNKYKQFTHDELIEIIICRIKAFREFQKQYDKCNAELPINVNAKHNFEDAHFTTYITTDSDIINMIKKNNE